MNFGLKLNNMNKETIYEAVRVKWKVPSLSQFERYIIDLTIEAIDELVIDEVTYKCNDA
jgi:hypothetical protein